MANQFLSAVERQGILRDWHQLLQGPEATNITLRYKIAGANPVPDPVFGVTDYDAEPVTVSVTGQRMIQAIVKPRDEEILAFGILDAGDAIFYAGLDTNLNVGLPGSMELITTDLSGDPASEVAWLPVPLKQAAFYRYLQARLGQTQVSQVIPCKLK